jgi:predicted transglutaminase-like cysteine proteinase
MVGKRHRVSKAAIVALAVILGFGGNALAAQTDGSDTLRLGRENQNFAWRDSLYLAGQGLRDAMRNVGRLASLSTTLPTLPRATPPATRNVDFNVFGSVVIPAGKLPMSGNWSRVTADISLCQTNCTGLGRYLTDVSREAEKLPTLAAMQLINRTVNKSVKYRTDKALWGKDDYWATPAEIVARRAGDCEDFAIAKMAMLREAGFEQNQLQLIVLKDVRKQVFHAVLAVHTPGGTYILDNMNNVVARDTEQRDYFPIMSFAEGKSYIHGFKTVRPEFASLGKSDLASALPGEAF